MTDTHYRFRPGHEQRRHQTAKTTETLVESVSGNDPAGQLQILSHPLHKPTRKELGAYYTDTIVAQFLVRWAVRASQDTVLDPAFGGGVFLRAAAERIQALGGDPGHQVYGVELESEACQAFASLDASAGCRNQIWNANFFDLRPAEMSSADAIVGNPPFIRYQRFNGKMRQTALARAQEAGVTISRLTSSWAPFLVHATQFVKQGGRLAMVAPAELAHASYARPVLEYLRCSFRTIRILTFSQRLFRELSEDTVLVLASGRGESFEQLVLIDLPGVQALGGYLNPEADLPAGIPVDARSVEQDHERLLHYLLPQRTRALYAELRSLTQVSALGEVADIGIGYVSGDNDFFHLDKQTVATFDLPPDVLKPAVRTGSELHGLWFTQEDWTALHSAGRANLLLNLSGRHTLPPSVDRYLRQGVLRGVPQRYKCRVRRTWYSVPYVYEADAFLTYMSGSVPKLVANQADAVAPNTLHVVRLHQEGFAGLTATSLATTWQTSLTALSSELEGHSLGGGMLKLEPTEAERVLIALPNVERTSLEALADDLDSLIRSGKTEEARQRADDMILHVGLGLTERDITELREAWLYLRARRLHR